MTVKMFDFLSFEEWNKTRCYCGIIGEFRCIIEPWGKGYDENHTTVYLAVISNANNPTNIYASHLIRDYYSCSEYDNEKLKEWYENIIVKFNDVWQKYILRRYDYCIENYFIADDKE